MQPDGIKGGKVRNAPFGKEGRGQGFDGGGIPSKNPTESQSGEAKPMTAVEKPQDSKIAKGNY